MFITNNHHFQDKNFHFGGWGSDVLIACDIIFSRLHRVGA